MEPIDTETMQRLRAWFEHFRFMRTTFTRLISEKELRIAGNLLLTEPNHWAIATLRDEDPDEA